MAKTQTNPFAEAFKAFGDFNSLGKLPTLDAKKLFSVQRRNVEALSAANQLATQSVQELTRYQARALQEATQESLRLAKEVFSTGGNPETASAKGTEFAKSLAENSIANLRESSEIASKASAELFDLLNKRAAETMSELAEVTKSDAKKN